MPVSYTLLLQPRFRSLLSDGTPNVGGKVYTYQAGTTIPATTYSNSDLTSENTNPVVLDADGQADIWFSGPYKVVVTDAAGVQLYAADNLFGFKSDIVCSLPVQDQDKLIAWDSVDGKFKNSTMGITYIEQCVDDFRQAVLTGGALVIVSPTDTTPGSLDSKIDVLPGAVKTIIDPGGNEKLQISADVPAVVSAAARVTAAQTFNGF